MADQFRAGHVPAMREPRKVVQRAFAALPRPVTESDNRGDSACHESDWVKGLRPEQRAGGPPGKVGLALSAPMSEALHAAIQAVPESEGSP